MKSVSIQNKFSQAIRLENVSQMTAIISLSELKAGVHFSVLMIVSCQIIWYDPWEKLDADCVTSAVTYVSLNDIHLESLITIDSFDWPSIMWHFDILIETWNWNAAQTQTSLCANVGNVSPRKEKVSQSIWSLWCLGKRGNLLCFQSKIWIHLKVWS